MPKCEACNGEGGWREHVEENYSSPFETCSYCRGTGKQSFSQWFWTRAPLWLIDWYADVIYGDKNE